MANIHAKQGIPYAESIPSVKDINPMSGSPKYSRAELDRQRQAKLEAERKRRAEKEAKQRREAAEREGHKRDLNALLSQMNNQGHFPSGWLSKPISKKATTI